MSRRVTVFGEEVPEADARELKDEAAQDAWNRALADQEEKLARTEPADLAPPPADPHYAETAPITLAPSDEPPPPRPVPMPAAAPASPSPALETVLAEARRNNRVCPEPAHWVKFYRLLTQHAGRLRLPPPPLTGTDWKHAPELAKRVCFREQLEWAERHGRLNFALRFLHALPEQHWHYMD